MQLIFKSVVFYFCFHSSAFAYLDPGTGSVIISTIIAFMVAGWNYIKAYYLKLKFLIKNKFLNKKDNIK